MMDDFVLNYTLERLDEGILQNKEDLFAYSMQTNLKVEALNVRTNVLEDDNQELSGTINTLVKMVEDITKDLSTTKKELSKTKLNNIKQEIVIRTLHNLQHFDAYDMYVDTFVDGSSIDWVRSVRGELLPELQAVGKSGKSYVKLEQISTVDSFLISINSSGDEAISQSFKIDKDQRLDKVSIFIEPHKTFTWADVVVSITESKGGPAVSRATLSVDKIVGGWVDIDMPNVDLLAHEDYYIEIKSVDPHGYRIGSDFTDQYLSGTSYGLFNNIWTDNNHDIAFKVWCFPSDDENNAIIMTKTKVLSEVPTHIVFEAEDEMIDGSVNYHVSIDDGVNWKILQPGMETMLKDLPDGMRLVIRATIIGSSYINAWGYVIKRGESQ